MNEPWYVIQMGRGEIGILGQAASQGAAERLRDRLQPRTRAALFVVCDSAGLDFWEAEARRIEDERED